MLRQVQIQHICIMRCKNQLFIVSDTIQHNTENPFFYIALNIRKMFITIIETALFCRHCSKEHCDINSFCCTTGQYLPIQQFTFLYDDFRSTAPNNKGIL